MPQTITRAEQDDRMQNRMPQPEDLEPIERASLGELRELQLSRLQWTVRHAYENVPHYRAAFESSGVHPSDVGSLEDLAGLPFTTKADLRDNYPFGMFAVPQAEVSRVHASSGTTGRPTVVGYTAEDVRTWASLMARSIRAAGGRPGDKVHVAYGYGLFTGGLGAHYGAEALGCTVIPVSGGMTERQVTLIRDFAPDVIMVTPSYMLAIVDEMERQGVDPRSTSLAVGIFGAEPWTNDMRAELEQRLDMHAVDIYGLSEVMGPGVAQECVETKDGLHIWEDHFYPEIVDPLTGDPLPDPRPDTAAARNGTADASDGEDHRPLRRHDDRSRGQCVPDPDRGTDPATAGAVSPLPVRAHATGPAGRVDGARRAATGRDGGRRRRGGCGAGDAGEERHRRHHRSRRRPTGRRGAVGGQDAPHHRPAGTLTAGASGFLLMAELDLRRRVQAVVLAYESGLVVPGHAG
jgi:hypothetical protein